MLMRLIASTNPQRTLLVHTPAKINIFLNVLGKRPDGYHELDTIMVAVNLYDTLRFRETASPGVLTLNSRWLVNDPKRLLPRIPDDDRNLVLKAAYALRDHVQRPELSAFIQLEKRIPSEAGLGGGSSDAAAALVGLNHFWNLNLTSEDLHHLASRLGSDVNFFLSPTPAATCTGRGEQIAPVPDLLPLHAVIIKPPSGLSTKAVFDAYYQHPSQVSYSSRELIDTWQKTPESLSSLVFNGLQAGACHANPDVEKILKHLSLLHEVTGIMTGSGTACVALVSSPSQATRLARHLRDQQHSFVVSVRSSL